MMISCNICISNRTARRQKCEIRSVFQENVRFWIISISIFSKFLFVRADNTDTVRLLGVTVLDGLANSRAAGCSAESCGYLDVNQTVYICASRACISYITLGLQLQVGILIRSQMPLQTLCSANPSPCNVRLSNLHLLHFTPRSTRRASEPSASVWPAHRLWLRASALSTFKTRWFVVPRRRPSPPKLPASSMIPLASGSSANSDLVHRTIPMPGPKPALRPGQGRVRAGSRPTRMQRHDGPGPHSRETR